MTWYQPEVWRRSPGCAQVMTRRGENQWKISNSMHFPLIFPLLVITCAQPGDLLQTSGCYQVNTRTPLERVGGGRQFFIFLFPPYCQGIFQCQIFLDKLWRKPEEVNQGVEAYEELKTCKEESSGLLKSLPTQGYWGCPCKGRKCGAMSWTSQTTRLLPDQEAGWMRPSLPSPS